jgi:hypothetical protein
MHRYNPDVLQLNKARKWIYIIFLYSVLNVVENLYVEKDFDTRVLQYVTLRLVYLINYHLIF